MIIDIAKHSRPGGHEINEDSLLCGNNIYVVADGLGGHSSGEVASAAAIEFVKINYNGDFSDTAVTALLEGANASVRSLENGSHTTIAAIFHNDDTVRFANVGDSRVYYFRHNKLFAMTKDHSVCQASIDMGEMTFDDIRTSSDRSRLLKVLGSEPQLNLRRMYEPISAADGDAFIVCSDGFWEHVYETEMEADLLKADSAESWMRNMMKRQLLRAEDKDDNCTVICGIIRSERTAPPLEAPPPPPEAPSSPDFAASGSSSRTPTPSPEEDNKKASKKKEPSKLRAGFLIAAVVLIFAAVVIVALSKIIYRTNPDPSENDDESSIVEETDDELTTSETDLPAIATIISTDAAESEAESETEAEDSTLEPATTTASEKPVVTTATTAKTEEETTTADTTTKAVTTTTAAETTEETTTTTTTEAVTSDTEETTTTTTTFVPRPGPIMTTTASEEETTTAPSTDEETGTTSSAEEEGETTTTTAETEAETTTSAKPETTVDEAPGGGNKKN